MSQAEFYKETMICGAVAGMVANAFTHPFDTAKALVQFQLGKKSTKEVTDSLLQTFKSEGSKPFFRGFNVVMLTTIPSTAIYFLSYEGGKKIIPGSEDSVVRQSLAGVIAQFCSSIIFTPRDVIKERLQVQRLQSDVQHYAGGWDAFKTIMRTQGVTGLYRGYWQTLSLWSIYGGLYLAIYTKVKTWTRHFTGYRENMMPPHLILSSAIFSASIAAAITNPLDVIKLHFQVKSDTESFWSILKNMTRVHGPRVWLRGTIARVAWVAPRTAISFATYESTKYALEKRKSKEAEFPST